MSAATGLDRKPRILVVDDDPLGCKLLRVILAPEGFEVDAAGTAAQALARCSSAPPDVIILDLRLPDRDGLEFLRSVHASNPQVSVIILTAYAEVKTAVQAIQLGALNYLTKPVDREEIVIVVRRALEHRLLLLEVDELRRQRTAASHLATSMGGSRPVRNLIEQVDVVAPSDFTVLLTGETGTGKELVARAVHHNSPRRDRPLVALDCGAIPEALLESELFGYERGAFTGAEQKREGHFQLAEGGTLFLDEVGNLPLALQSKLLRVLESREVRPVGGTRLTPLDVRFVAATNEELPRRVHDGTFREDLYYRLAQFTIALPPLRERREDIPYLVQRFLEDASVELRRPVQAVTPDALAARAGHDWPGNVRELRNLVRQAVLRSKTLVLDRTVVGPMLERPVASQMRRTESQPIAGRTVREIAESAAEEAERAAIVQTLAAARGNKTQAARVLGTDFKTLHLKMKRYGIRPGD
ncbi:MAG: sigma-54-dependent Fis family transcriptional regulator [Candidatus Schekmanbacteria bacterium]|nr:sigma-54-dependent Fis family transcriptional regulator [Candidatus Schekmanbacteria bacterium]